MSGDHLRGSHHVNLQAGRFLILRCSRREPDSPRCYLPTAGDRAYRRLRNDVASFGHFTLKQTDYQIKPISLAGGAIKLKDELKLSFAMVAREQQ